MENLPSPIEEAAATLASLCEANEHKTDFHETACLKSLPLLGKEIATRKYAHSFDARKKLLAEGNTCPSHNWSTSALLTYLKGVFTLHLQSSSYIQRHVFATSALYTLANRGLPPDGIIRTCMTSTIVEFVEILTYTYYLERKKPSFQKIPHLEHWASVFAENLTCQLPQDYDLWDLIQNGQRSNFPEIIEDWLSRASMGDLLNLKGHDYLESPPESQELRIASSKSALIWVYQRFTETYLSDWNTDSLHWELTFNRMPTTVCNSLSLREEMLAERIILDEDIVTEISRRIIDEGTIKDGMEYQRIPLSLLEKGDINTAQSLALRLARSYPDNDWYEALVVFTRIPTNPASARRKLLLQKDEETCATYLANIASTQLAEGLHDEYQETLTKIDKLPDETLSQTIYLWWPSSLSSRPIVRLGSLKEWLTDARNVIA